MMGVPTQKETLSILDILHENTCGILGGEEGNVFRVAEGLIVFSAKLEAGVCGQVIKWFLMERHHLNCSNNGRGC